jgi:chromosome segregation ATPase
MNGEVINKANEIANLKADLDTLRNKLADTEAALGRTNAEVSRMTVGCRQVEEGRDYMHQQWSNAEQRANYAESHPWRNLWVWVKRKVARHE